MKFCSFNCGLLLSLALSSANAARDEWPKLVNGQNSAECKAAMRLAKWAYTSDNFTLWAPPIIPDDFGYTMVVGPEGSDLSGGDALDVDVDVDTFTKIPLPEYEARSIYWQIEPRHGERMVIEEIGHGWRGDAYNVRSIDLQTSEADYFAARKSGVLSTLPALIDGGWRAPLVFKKDAGQDLWMIYVGEPYVFSPNWSVYASDSTRLKLTCEIRFRPDVKNASFLLPRPIQRLSILLDQTIGSGQNEGTLQPTARIRIDVQQAWVNAALRPWATGEPYNTREEVDTNLETWSGQGLAYRKTYTSIEEQYPRAERALSKYYGEKFRMPKGEAESTAKRVLDSVLRIHYIFPRERLH